MDRIFQMVCSFQCYSKSCSISLFNIFQSPTYGGFTILYSPPSFIPTVHLFVIQPCTQVSVPLSSFFDFLEVIVVENTVQGFSPH